MPEDISRRRFVGLVSATAGAAIAGCTTAPQAESEPAESPEENTQSGTDSPSVTHTETEFELGDAETPTEDIDPDDLGQFSSVFREAKDEVVQIRVLGGETRGSSGTGWLFDDDGHIVTNEHVIGGATDVFIRFRETGWIQADLVGTDVYSDLGVLSVDDQPSVADPLPVAQADPPVGTEVLAMGNPFGLSGSISAGIVSGVNRTLPAPNNFSIPDAIQTDAAVNPGNSGGPLLDTEGDVIGVINSGGGDNIGFAISGALASRVLPALIETGNYDHPFLGIRLAEVTPSIAAANDLETASGIYVDSVPSDGPSAGILQGSDGQTSSYGQVAPVGGDIIKRLDDTPIPTRQALASFLALETSPGETVDVEIVRDGSRQTVQVTIGTRPDPPSA